MSEPFIGEIRMVAFNFAPVGWAFCDGQLLPVSQNDALFALIGTTYGGDGMTTFGLPNLQGRVPVHMGTGIGLSTKHIGSLGGAEGVVVNSSTLPVHTHSATVNMACSAEAAGGGSPVGNVPAVPAAGLTGVKAYASTGTGAMGESSGTTTAAGGNQPHNNMQPFLAVNFIIALEGVFPSRN